MLRTRSLATVSGLVLLGLLTACGTSPVTERPTVPATEATPEEEAPAETGDGTHPEWAHPVTTPGDLIASGEDNGFRVDIYQVGTTAATKTGQFMTPEGEPVISVGDEIVFLNYVFTNTGTADIPLSYSLVSVSARYASWPYLQGMDSVVDSGLFEQMQVNNSALAPGGDSPFVWTPGTSFSYGENFLYEKGGAITFDVRLVPADENGELVHDARQTFEISGVTV